LRKVRARVLNVKAWPDDMLKDFIARGKKQDLDTSLFLFFVLGKKMHGLERGKERLVPYIFCWLNC
jgi:hypothetical protein